MVDIRFASGHAYAASDDSTYSYMTFMFNSFAAVDALAAEFTVEGMHTVTVGTENYARLIPLTFTATLIGEGAIKVVLTAREMTEMEVINERLNENTEAIAELADMVIGG